MREAVNPTSFEAEAREVRTVRKQVCPFCGTMNERGDLACPTCGMEDTPGTRQATRARIGPWFVLQHKNPAAPGMNFSTLMTLVHKGRLTARSVVRGPTTHQLWRLAAKVKGLSREFGVCWGCAAEVNKTAKLCPNCKRMQEAPLNPDMLLEGRDEPAAVGPIASLRFAPEAKVGGPVEGVGTGHNVVTNQASEIAASFPRPGVATALTGRARVGLAEGMGDVVGAGSNASHADMSVFNMDGRPGRTSRPVLKATALLVCLILAGATIYFVLNPSAWGEFHGWVAGNFSSMTGNGGKAPVKSKGVNPVNGVTGLSAQTSDPEVGPGHVQNAPQPAPMVVENPKPETPAAEAAPELTIGKKELTLKDAEDQENQLRFKAFQAQNNHKYEEARGYWLQMKDLPEAVWHKDIDQRIEDVDKMIKNAQK